MTKEFQLRAIIECAQSCDYFVKGLKWYIIGSYLLPENSHPADIDVVIIYSNMNDLTPVKKELKQISFRTPIHLTCLSFAEENEIDFLNRTRHEEIFPNAFLRFD